MPQQSATRFALVIKLKTREGPAQRRDRKEKKRHPFMIMRDYFVLRWVQQLRILQKRREVYMCLVRVSVLATSFILVTGPAPAQAPQVEKNVSMALSLAIMQGALDQCTKDGYKVSVVIVDKGGNVAASVRGDGTPPHTMDFARMKAYTARTRNQTSLATMKQMEDPAFAFLRQIPNVVGVGGGVPIRAGDEVIGGVGVSGAPGGEKDEACANAGLAKVAGALK
jgi:uncharacterized protein GlcG (DUF336 family)